MNRIYEEARQLPIFGGEKPFRTEKPIRLIELFAGYGSQALALKYLGVHFEHWKISEWAVKSISAYKDLHFGKDETDYSAGLTAEQIKEWLVGRISADYSTPMTEKQIAKLPEKQARKIYGNMQATHNLGSITKMRGEDLQITDTDRYEYIMTYSFPCQDLSNAGKGAGMGRNSGTRSGLLWEVERLLKETENLPQILLMENVPEVIGKKNIKHFSEWIGFLDSLGYKSKRNLLNAKNFGIPQNRNRCFMVSILGDYYYEMPDGFALDYVLRDFLDYGVDESYYLSDKAVRALELHKERNAARGNNFGWNPTFGGVQRTPLKQRAATDRTVTLSLSGKGKIIEKIGTTTANAIMARDCKGFGNQAMNAVAEYRGRTASRSEKAEASQEHPCRTSAEQSILKGRTE